MKNKTKKKQKTTTWRTGSRFFHVRKGLKTVTLLRSFHLWLPPSCVSLLCRASVVYTNGHWICNSKPKCPQLIESKVTWPKTGNVTQRGGRRVRLDLKVTKRRHQSVFVCVSSVCGEVPAMRHSAPLMYSYSGVRTKRERPPRLVTVQLKMGTWWFKLMLKLW